MKCAKCNFCLAILVGFLLTALPISMFGQTQTTGSVSGSVKDQTGAFLPGVDVKVEQEGTGAVHDTISTEVGVYTVPLLPPGRYTVTFTLPGFQTIVNRGVVVAA